VTDIHAHNVDQLMQVHHPIDTDRLAVQRTTFAADRTLMAWMRTAISLIGFGFTLFKFLRGLEAMRPAGALADRDPKTVGLLMIGLGLVALGAAIAQYWQFLRGLGERPRSLAMALALVFWLIGAVAFASVLVD
jgi:putative membrane protein